MNAIDKFYKKTDGFWKMTRILFIPMFIYPLFKVLENKNLFYAILNASCGIYALLLILLIVNKTSKSNRRLMRKWVGILSIFYGLITSAFLLKLELELSDITTSYFQIFPIWVILFGFWELNSLRASAK